MSAARKAAVCVAIYGAAAAAGWMLVGVLIATVLS